MLDSSQVISGLAVLLSFFVGYKYGLKIQNPQLEEDDNDESGKSKTSSGNPKKMVRIH